MKVGCSVGGLAKIYSVMGGGVVAYLALGRGDWIVLPVFVGVWLLTIVGGRLLGKSIRGSRRRSRWPLFASVVTWLLLVVVTFLAGVAVLPHLGGG